MQSERWYEVHSKDDPYVISQSPAWCVPSPWNSPPSMFEGPTFRWWHRSCLGKAKSILSHHDVDAIDSVWLKYAPKVGSAPRLVSYNPYLGPLIKNYPQVIWNIFLVLCASMLWLARHLPRVFWGAQIQRWPLRCLKIVWRAFPKCPYFYRPGHCYARAQGRFLHPPYQYSLSTITDWQSLEYYLLHFCVELNP